MLKQSEKDLHSQICEYIKIKYPNVLFNSDMAGVKLTIGQATHAKTLRSHNGFPDLVIYEPKKNYSGLFLELKAEGTKIHKKDGTFVSEHLREQDYVMQKLREKGFYAQFSVGFDATRNIIDWYLGK